MEASADIHVRDDAKMKSEATCVIVVRSGYGRCQVTRQVSTSNPNRQRKRSERGLKQEGGEAGVKYMSLSHVTSLSLSLFISLSLSPPPGSDIEPLTYRSIIPHTDSLMWFGHDLHDLDRPEEPSSTHLLLHFVYLHI